LPPLHGVDVVVNAVGISREHGQQTFDAIHVRTPHALFSACAVATVKIIQISALGADAGAGSRYHTSKRKADDMLLQVCEAAVVVQPSLVYGPGGTSASLFTLLASLPFIPLPDRGSSLVQPIHIDDVAQVLVTLVETDLYRKCRVPLVGQQAVSLHDFLSCLRQAMGLSKGLYLLIPPNVTSIVARMTKIAPGTILDKEILQMLRRGNTADASATQHLLGRAPRPVSLFITPREASGARVSAQLGWLLPVLRCAIALVWIFSGVVSLGLYPVEQSYAMLSRVGLTGWAASGALYGAALLDFSFGVATLIRKRRRMLWIAQATAIVLYTGIITLWLPEFWLHPFGPILKNLPLLVGIWMLYELEKR